MKKTLITRATAATVALSLAFGTSVVANAEETSLNTEVSKAEDTTFGEMTITGSADQATDGLALRATTGETEGYSIDSTQSGDQFSQVITIDGVTSPDTYTFDFDLPEGITLSEAPDGGAFFRSANGEVNGRVKAPWAVDAAGREVPTQFEVRDNQLVQTVELSEDLQYPVTADPEGAWGWTKCIAAVSAAIVVPVGGVVKLARFVKSIGNVREALQLLFGASTNQERLDAGLAAAGATAGELLGIAAIQQNC